MLLSSWILFIMKLISKAIETQGIAGWNLETKPVGITQ